MFTILALFIFGWISGQEKTMEEIAAMPNDTNKVWQWLQQSDKAIATNYEQAKQLADSANMLAKRLNYNRGIYLAEERLGHAEMNLANYKAALVHYTSAFHYYEKTGNKGRMASTLNRMGESVRLMDDYELALEYLQQSLTLNQELKDTNEVGSAYISIGILYAMQGNKKEAENYFLKATESFKSIGNTAREYLTILNLGGLYREMQEYDKSIAYSEKARDYFKETGNDRRLAIAYYNLGVAYFEMNKLEDSKREYERCLVIFERLGDNLRINGTNMRLSEIALKQGDLAVALVLAQKSLAGFKETGSLSQLRWAYEHLANIYEAKRDYANALVNRKLYDLIKDSVISTETNERIAELEKKYQSELTKTQLAEANAALELKDLRVRRQQVQQRILIGLVVAIAVILLLLYMQFNTNKKNAKILGAKNEIIQKSLNEKEVLLKEIHHRVKNNLQFISSLLNLQARHVQDPQTLAVLNEGKNRVYSMALVHQKLYQEENLTGVQMNEYLYSLVESLLHSYQIDPGSIDLKLDVQHMYLDIDTASPIGLIVNELVTNALKYAFSEKTKGELRISFYVKNEEIMLIIKDNGPGFPAAVQSGDTRRFGIKLIESLADKLKALVRFENENGAAVYISIPYKNQKQ